MPDMRRRQFISLLGGAAATWPVGAGGQSAKLRTIGFLGATTASAQKKWTDAFVQRLRELDWIEGRTVAIEYRWTEGRTERAADIFADFVRLKVDIIVTHPTALALAAKQATSLIPIVFALAGDPVGSGLVASLARPGGNVTGLSLQMPDVLTKRLELLREVVPRLRRLMILVNVGNLIAMQELRSVQELAGTLGIDTTISEIRRAEDIEAAFEGFNGRSEALYVCTEPLVNIHRARINVLALNAHLPSVVGFREFVEAGGLISFGPNYPALWRRSAEFVDKILRGAKPADIPVEQPTKFDLVINLQTAKALGLEVPVSLLARADEVIE
jgi:putative tryptophan/tyrosine transport system substrate-binding protein